MTQTPPISAEQVEAAAEAMFNSGGNVIDWKTALGIAADQPDSAYVQAVASYRHNAKAALNAAASIPASRWVERVTVQPWETRPTGDDAMEPSEIDVHEGAWAVIIGTNDKPAGWIDTHELFAHQLYRDQILPTETVCAWPNCTCAPLARCEYAASPAQPVQQQEPVAWLHPTAGWASAEREKIAPHCLIDGSDGGPVPLYRASPPEQELTKVEAAEEAEDEAKDCFWAIYPEYLQLGGKPVSTETARTALAAKVERLTEALNDLARWADAYPLSVFPEPDFAKAAQVLKSAGMTLDAISASNMRHAIEGVGKIARVALEPKP